MASSRWRLWDPVAAAAAAIVVVMTAVYLMIIGSQDGQPATWFVAGLTVAGLLCLYGTFRALPGRRWALGASGVMLVGFGLLGILSVGLPILVAGALAVVAAARVPGAVPAGAVRRR